MKILVIVGHPTLEKSKVSKAWKAEIEERREQLLQDGIEIDTHVLRPDVKYDTKEEQALLLQYDRIVLQFPFYLYSCPAFMWSWIQQVLTYGWAYGMGPGKLHQKEMLIGVSIGGPDFSYRSGDYNDYTIDEYLRVFERIASLCGMKFLRYYALFDAMRCSPEELKESCEAYVNHITDTTLGSLAYVEPPVVEVVSWTVENK